VERTTRKVDCPSEFHSFRTYVNVDNVELSTDDIVVTVDMSSND